MAALVVLMLCFLCTCNQLLWPVESALSPCKKDDFGSHNLPCDSDKRTRKIVYYMKNECDLTAKASVAYPAPITDIPCHCKPGEGWNGINLTSCVKCPIGQYSHGGELISDWKNWNASQDTPGLYYGMHTYCSDFLSGKSCNKWRPSGDFSYLISGEFKNSTKLRCFEQSMLVFSRKFVLPEAENTVSFDYKVDGANCRKGSISCSQGLHFYINGELVLKKDTQFDWIKFKKNVKPGMTKFMFVYHKSCTRDAILDVAYVRHLSIVGASATLAPCSQCNAGSYANTTGSSECTKCFQNEYQDQTGQKDCKQCPVGQFSRIGATKCIELPDCTSKDYYMMPESLDKCVKNGTSDVYVRNQNPMLPIWPGVSHVPCKGTKNKPKSGKVQCRCQSGHKLDLSDTKPSNNKCIKCGTGTYSDGKMNTCKTCPTGHAAVPGLFFDSFPDTNIPEVFKQECSGTYCQVKDKQYWKPRGDHMATRRLPGNFETTFELADLDIDYYNAYISFNCSVDCRMSIGGKRLAKHDDCFLRFDLRKWNETGKEYYSIHGEDCVNKYRQHMRDGRVLKHTFPMPTAGKYSLRALFHHQDEGNYSLLSYEAKIYRLDIFGVKSGSAKGCVKCQAGTFLADGGAFCRKCPNGTYSKEGATECKPCPDGEFADKEGSSACTKCGNGTSSNKNRDGCDYHGCMYHYNEDTVYDLSPLRVDGGPMYRVKTYRPKSKYFFPLIYYINICSLKHDNTSCTTMKRIDNNGGRGTTRKQVIVPTMACKRWSFDEQSSYSIGEVLSFLPRVGNETNGLLIQLTEGYRCWNKALKVYKSPITNIHMKCDMFAGVGYPEPLSNATGIDNHCVFEIQWRSEYACRLCHKGDYRVIEGLCNDEGQQAITTIRGSDCRPQDNHPAVTVKSRLCSKRQTSDDGGEKNATPTPLIVAIVVAVLVIIILIIFVVYFAKRNRYLRGRIFVPGKSFSKVQDEDEDELVDNMS